MPLPEAISRHHNLAFVYGKRTETYPQAIEAWETVLEMGLARQDDYHIRASRQEIARLRRELEANPGD